MVRVAAAQRLQAVAAAGTRVFGRLGYRRTHMADVAAEAGLSSGAIYTYVASKDALFHLVFAWAFDEIDGDAADLPLPTPSPDETLALIARGLGRTARTPRMRDALSSPVPDDVAAEVRGIIEERYEMVARLWPILAVIEASAIDVPGLDELYFQRGRRGQLNQLARYLADRASAGALRPIADAEITARVVTESIAWFAWHRRDSRDAAGFDEDVTRATVVQFCCDGLVEPEPRP